MECVHASSATTGFDAEIKCTDKIGLYKVVQEIASASDSDLY